MKKVWKLLSPSAVYIHIPAIEQESLKALYFEQLHKEINLYTPIKKGYAIDSVYLDYQGKLAFDPRVLDTFATLRNRTPINNETEVTIEVDLNNIKLLHLLFWKKLGVNRISVRITDPSMVSNIGYAMSLCAHFFENNTLDIHISSYSKLISEWSFSLSQISLDAVHHVGFYVGEQFQTEEVCDMYSTVRDRCHSNGLIQYESFHFAREGYASRYMKLLWERKPHIGFGTEAESFDGISRLKNVQSVQEYIHAMSNKGTACDTNEVLTEEQIFLERLMLGIRRSEGINIDLLIEEKSVSYQQEMRDRIMHLVNQGYVSYHQGVVRLQPKGYIVERGVISYLAL